MNGFFNWRQRGIPLGKINALMAAVTVLMSALLLVITYQTGVSYRSMRDTTEQYIDWKNRAYDMQIGSDYLTEQARCFVETGDRQFLDNYFKEAEVTRRRDRALDALREIAGESDAFRALQEAMDQSVSLMDREYYAMALTARAYGLDLSEFPQAVRDVELSPGDAGLSPAKMSQMARGLVFDDAYHAQKQAISDAMALCLEELDTDMEAKQSQSSGALQRILLRQRTLIILLIAITLSIVLLTSLLVISPLLRAVLHIRDDQMIPVRGAYEFRFLAQTYNLMYEVNRESKAHLAFEASHDKLTGLLNRGGYDLAMENTDLADCALLLMDVDHFKEINDSQGHEAGDRLLAWIASVIRGSFRSQDYVCRIGGDEFAVLLKAVGPQFTEMIRGKVRLINDRLQAPSEEGLSPASVSVGVAFGAPDPTPRGLYTRADAALYRVKFHGRRGCAFDGEEEG